MVLRFLLLLFFIIAILVVVYVESKRIGLPDELFNSKKSEVGWQGAGLIRPKWALDRIFLDEDGTEISRDRVYFKLFPDFTISVTKPPNKWPLFGKQNKLPKKRTWYTRLSTKLIRRITKKPIRNHVIDKMREKRTIFIDLEDQKPLKRKSRFKEAFDYLTGRRFKGGISLREREEYLDAKSIEDAEEAEALAEEEYEDQVIPARIVDGRWAWSPSPTRNGKDSVKLIFEEQSGEAVLEMPFLVKYGELDPYAVTWRDTFMYFAEGRSAVSRSVKTVVGKCKVICNVQRPLVSKDFIAFQ